MNKTTAFNADDLPLMRLDALTKSHTAFTGFMDMMNAKGNYRPSFYLDSKSPSAKSELVELANAYDAAQISRGHDRRSYRVGSGWPVSKSS